MQTADNALSPIIIQNEKDCYSELTLASLFPMRYNEKKAKEALLMQSPKKQYYENLADSLIEKFNMRGIEGYYCETKEEALKKALELIQDYNNKSSNSSSTSGCSKVSTLTS